ncbi:50S ribosomal protein L5 [bacterium SM23_57]|nr:MAG: 50S ribosomal protein L5 [bacterium SM23_57]
MADIPRMKKYYIDNVLPAMQKRFGYSNVMMVPKLEKIIVNVGVGEASQNPKLLESVMEEIGLITGLKPAIARAKKSISNFKLRQGMPIGCHATLRRNRMYEFFDRLMNVAIPRIRDFRGLSDRSFDGRGNYSMGIREQIIFPEIDYDKIDKIRGMNITIVTTANTDEEALELLKEFGFPFRRRVEAEATTEAA